MSRCLSGRLEPAQALATTADQPKARVLSTNPQVSSMRCACVLLLIERSATLMPTPPASMSRRSAGVMRNAPEPDTRPTSYDNKYNWTAKAQAPMGATTAQNRLAALKAAAESDERTIRAKWSDPRTIAGLCVFIPLLGAGVLISRVYDMRRGEQRAIATTSPGERLTARSTQALLRRVPRDLAGVHLRVEKYRARGLVFSSRRRINTQLYVPRAMDDPSSV